jgi:hypothetical protein
MKKFIFIGLVIFTVVYWTEVSSFVSGNLSAGNINITKWLVDHTPKK